MGKNAISSRFFNDLLETNDIPGFSRWFFYSGMLFGSSEKWWGKGGKRPSPHEGLDICFFHDCRGNLKNLDGEIRIPAMDHGVVYHISDDDFIDTSIFIRHDFRDKEGHCLHSVYAHSHPVDNLKNGDDVRYGDIIATMGDPAKRNLSIPAHIHVSLMYLPDGYSKDMLTWQILSQSHQARLMDPLVYLKCDYVTQPYTA